jgi:hypothetical protein
LAWRHAVFLPALVSVGSRIVSNWHFTKRFGNDALDVGERARNL